MKAIIVGVLVIASIEVFASEEKTTYSCTDMYNDEKVSLIETVIRDSGATSYSYEIDEVMAGCQTENCSVIASYSDKKNVKVHAIEFEKCKKLKTIIKY